MPFRLLLVALLASAVGSAHPEHDPAAEIRLTHRYVHPDFGAISYDAFVPREALRDPNGYARVLDRLHTLLAERLHGEDCHVAFRLYVIDVAFIPIAPGDLPLTLEIPRTEIERRAYARETPSATRCP